MEDCKELLDPPALDESGGGGGDWGSLLSLRWWLLLLGGPIRQRWVEVGVVIIVRRRHRHQGGSQSRYAIEGMDASSPSIPSPLSPLRVKRGFKKGETRTTINIVVRVS